MAEEDYSKRELDMKFNGVQETIYEVEKDLKAEIKALGDITDAQFEAKMDMLRTIDAKVTKTNGTVINHETRISGQENWRQFILGGFAVFSLLVLPFLGFVVYQVLQNTSSIEVIRASIEE